MPWRKPELVTGAGSIREIPRLLAEAGVKKVLLVTGPNIVKTIGKRIMAILEAAGVSYAVFSEVEANPSVTTAERIYERHTYLTRFLTGLGVDPKVAAEDACRIEHVISSESFHAIKDSLKEE